jgi:TRAP-type mannitol/chloroaromatic compound transport system permease small subunit
MTKLEWGLAIIVAMAAAVFLALLFCRPLLPVAKMIDKLSGYFGVIANWLILLACLVSAGNAILRYIGFGSSNAWLELQWYMFGGMVLLGAAYTLRVNEHVRVDLIYGMVTDQTRNWIDLICGVVFLMPMCILLMYFSWPWFYDSWLQNEASNNSGGLTRWPVKLIIPLGFFLLAMQGFSEIIKRAAAIKGFYVHEFAYEKPLQ